MLTVRTFCQRPRGNRGPRSSRFGWTAINGVRSAADQSRRFTTVFAVAPFFSRIRIVKSTGAVEANFALNDHAQANGRGRSVPASFALAQIQAC